MLFFHSVGNVIIPIDYIISFRWVESTIFWGSKIHHFQGADRAGGSHRRRAPETGPTDGAHCGRVGWLVDGFSDVLGMDKGDTQ